LYYNKSVNSINFLKYGLIIATNISSVIKNNNNKKYVKIWDILYLINFINHIFKLTMIYKKKKKKKCVCGVFHW